jgi:CheY-like chemotaxis protein
MQEFTNLLSSNILVISLLLSIGLLYARFSKLKNKKSISIDSKENDKELHVSDTTSAKSLQTENIETSISQTAQKTKRRRKLKAHDLITKDSFNIFRGSKLLIAEDNLINQKVIHGMLSTSGIEIFMANNGQEALEILSKNKDIYLVLMDAHMPVVDGFEATEHIRADKSLEHVVVIALSGDTAADDVKKMKNAGMTEHLEKPLKIEKLYEMLYYYIDTVDGINFNLPLSDKKYLHVEKGIEICADDNALYKEILNDFLSTYENSEQKINSLVDENSLINAQKLLLDISGITANIGAQEVASIATHYREALIKNDQNQIFIYENEFAEAFSNLTNEVKNFLNNN